MYRQANQNDERIDLDLTCIAECQVRELHLELPQWYFECQSLAGLQSCLHCAAPEINLRSRSRSDVLRF